MFRRCDPAPRVTWREEVADDQRHDECAARRARDTRDTRDWALLSPATSSTARVARTLRQSSAPSSSSCAARPSPRTGNSFVLEDRSISGTDHHVVTLQRFGATITGETQMFDAVSITRFDGGRDRGREARVRPHSHPFRVARCRATRPAGGKSSPHPARWAAEIEGVDRRHERGGEPRSFKAWSSRGRRHRRNLRRRAGDRRSRRRRSRGRGCGRRARRGAWSHRA